MSALRTLRLLPLAGTSKPFAGILPPVSARRPMQYGSVRLYSDYPPQTIFSADFWKSLVPKPLRRENRTAMPKKRTKEWNPATFYIVVFLFIGSMSIQMIQLRKEFTTFMRKSEVRIGLLREVVEKLQKGEAVDVEQTLGSGNAEKEQEWVDVLHEIERSTPKAKPQRQKKKPSPETEPKVPSEPEPAKTKPSSTEFF